MSAKASATFEIPAPATPVRCIECSNRACDALRGVPGVARVDCEGSGTAMRVEFDPARVSQADLEAQLSRFGLESASSVHHAAWRVTGLD